MFSHSKEAKVIGGKRTMSVVPKTIGRNRGFVANILSANRTFITAFYAKVQSVSMDTVLIHHILQEMKCGPDVFNISLLQFTDGYHHGVVTKKVQGWSMISAIAQIEKDALIMDSAKLLSATFLLNVLIELGRFGGIPSNGDNWGFINTTHHPAPYPGLAVVDFSRGTKAHGRFESLLQFRKGWKKCLDFLITQWQIVDDGKRTLHNNPLSKDTMELHADSFSFLHSTQTFTDLLQTACDQTALWLQETIVSARISVIVGGSCPYNSAPSDASVHTIVHPFRFISRPNTANLPAIYEQMVVEYMKLVAEWNTSLTALFTWFPFQFDASGKRCRGQRDNVRSQSKVENIDETKETFVRDTGVQCDIPNTASSGFVESLKKGLCTIM